MKSALMTIVCATLALALLAGCAPRGSDPLQAVDQTSDPAGFWKGLWHGFIVLFTFVISLFTDKVGIYEIHNSGNLYNLGYVLGVMIFFGGSGGGACKSAK